ncbi:endo-1,4-beta-xylanase [Rhizobium sp. ARZ01]|uniref:endo-1,4-beta-xylanase n=1 Tax=Rhizobium sp. ARZ01 TaxID=2769313 RepID=UPI00177B8038|nr:endo-1,4-beta-xylanase [Rhizobium sp. ARZ01]MBD9375017.1 endo-1,4-beta-xylanase [Rhizobium sp. ARZ01]
MRRREFVLGALASGIGYAGALDASFTKQIEAKASEPAAIPYGAAVRVDHLKNNFDYRRAILNHCQIVVGEGGLKWIDLRPDRDQFVFDQPDRLLAFAEENGLQMRGHTLAWYGAMPEWTETIATPKEAQTELVRHIETVVARYKGRIPSWDVVNEAIADTPTGDAPIRESMWQNRLGKGYIELALRTAAFVDPDAQLVINDYNFENPTEQCRTRRQAFLNLVRDLKDRDVPLHAIGLQGHLPGDQEIDREGLSRFVAELHGMGLAILVTELDVIDNNLPASNFDRDEIVASRARDFLGAIGDVCRPEAILTWGITDQYTWVPIWFSRSDGRPNRPLPLDANYRPKALMRVIQEFTRGDR